MFDEDYGVQSYFGESDSNFFGDTSNDMIFGEGYGQPVTNGQQFFSEAVGFSSDCGEFISEAVTTGSCGEMITEASTNSKRADDDDWEFVGAHRSHVKRTKKRAPYDTIGGDFSGEGTRDPIVTRNYTGTKSKQYREDINALNRATTNPDSAEYRTGNPGGRYTKGLKNSGQRIMRQAHKAEKEMKSIDGKNTK